MAIGQRKVWDARAHYKEGDHNASTCIRVSLRIDIVAFLTPSRLLDGEDERGGDGGGGSGCCGGGGGGGCGGGGCGDGGGLGYTSIWFCQFMCLTIVACA